LEGLERGLSNHSSTSATLQEQLHAANEAAEKLRADHAAELTAQQQRYNELEATLRASRTSGAQQTEQVSLELSNVKSEVFIHWNVPLCLVMIIILWCLY
jgi:Fe2+ transport system protein B